MTKDSYIVTKNQPHDGEDGCGSSDALQVYSDGHAMCYSCNEHIKNYEEYLENEKTNNVAPVNKATTETAFSAVIDMEDINSLPYRGCRDRRVDRRIICLLYTSPSPRD